MDGALIWSVVLALLEVSSSVRLITTMFYVAGRLDKNSGSTFAMGIWKGMLKLLLFMMSVGSGVLLRLFNSCLNCEPAVIV